MKEILELITRDPGLEGRWLNTLSLLEYIGSRKIGKTFAKIHPSLEVLNHQADEARHAAIFKKLATIVSETQEPSYLCPQEAMHYFQILDRRLSNWLTELTKKTDPYQNYLLVTATVERRAMNLYPLYRKLTRNGFVRDELRQVIEEESSHRRSIEENTVKILNHHDVPDFAACDAVEEELFSSFMESIRKEISTSH